MASPLRILRIIARLNVGGPARHVINLNGGLDARGHETELLFGEPSLREGSLEGLIAGRGLHARKLAGLGRSVKPGQDWRAFLEIRRAIADFRPDVVHTHTAKAGALGRVAAWLYNLGRSRAQKTLIVHTFHGHVLDGYFGPGMNRVVRAAERGLASLSHRIIAISPRQRADLVDRFHVAPASKVTVVPLGLDLEALLALPERTPPATGLRIGFVGRFVPIKDVPTLVQGFALAHRTEPSMTLTLVGGGELEESVRASVTALGLDSSVVFEPFQESLSALYARFDVVVLTSRNEGTPVALIEAMAAGCAVVATRVGGVPDVVDDGTTGLLMPAGDPPALADALLALQRDPRRVREMGVLARASVGAKYSVTRLVDDVERLYAQGVTTLRGAGAR